MSLINVSNLTFSYEGSYDNIFENVSFQIDTDWKLGFVGRNGRGKTTFLKLLLGEYEYSGKITASVNFEYFPFQIINKSNKINASAPNNYFLQGQPSKPYIDAESNSDENMTIDIIYNIYPDLEQWRLIRELSLLEVDDDVLYRPFKSLSFGEQTKVLLAVLFLKENSFLLIDEPTNHLDMHGRKLVSDYLNSKKGFILVSHDRAFLDNCVDHVLSINKTNIEIQKGNFSSWWENKRRQDNYELAQNEKLKKDILRLKEAARRAKDWSDKAEKVKYDGSFQGFKDRGYIGHKAAKMMKRSKSIKARQEAAIEEKSKLLKNIESSEKLKLTQLDFHKSKFIEMEGISIYYGEKQICRDISFTVNKGDRIALMGKNGSGKSSLLKLICGEAISYEGIFRRAAQLKISYLPQGTSHLSGNLDDYAYAGGIDLSLFKAILRKLDFSREQFDKDMSCFSAGQKKKVLIAKSLCEKAHLHVWDEPLNYIDIISRMQIEDLILEYQPTLLFVEHDRSFCSNIASKILEL